VERLVGQGCQRQAPRPLLTDAPKPTSATRLARRDARASGLRYVSPDKPGIRRRRVGRGFTYTNTSGRRVLDEDTLARIRRIAIPPAWTDVWICPSADGHIQATGRDSRGRRQYRYHPAFRDRRDAGKFARLVRFGELLPRIRGCVRRDLRRGGLPREKVLAAVVALLERTSLRVGNPEYASLNRSFGLTTLRDRHARIRGATVRFRFRGKGGQIEERDLIDRRLAVVVRRCQDLPGQDLFQYEAADGDVRAIVSEDVNEYIRAAAGDAALSAKDFRTWSATLHAFRELRAAPAEAPPRRRKSLVLEALRQTAEELGNTLAVTRSSYVHPGVLASHEAGEARSGSMRTTPPDRPPTRDDELALLALLRGAARHDASRPKVRHTAAAGCRTR
jgi:DNA topoisomerase-1